MEHNYESPVLFKGDVPPSVRRQIVEYSDFHIRDVNFAHSTGRGLKLTEAAVYRRPEDKKLQSRVVYQTTVDEGVPPAALIARMLECRPRHRPRALPRGATGLTDARLQTCSTASARSTAGALRSSSTCESARFVRPRAAR